MIEADDRAAPERLNSQPFVVCSSTMYHAPSPQVVHESAQELVIRAEAGRFIYWLVALIASVAVAVGAGQALGLDLKIVAASASGLAVAVTAVGLWRGGRAKREGVRAYEIRISRSEAQISFSGRGHEPLTLSFADIDDVRPQRTAQSDGTGYRVAFCLRDGRIVPLTPQHHGSEEECSVLAARVSKLLAA